MFPTDFEFNGQTLIKAQFYKTTRDFVSKCFVLIIAEIEVQLLKQNSFN